jgi:serine/threonine-protein kinase
MSQWDHIKTILDGALEREGAARRAYVEQADLDEAAREEIESLLAAYDESESFFDTWTRGERSGVAGERRRIGAYRVLERLGRGGTSAVYRAERDDDQFQRQVALKVLHRGREDADFAQRFVSERQILASLHHPHIAQLYDGGLTEDGRPFFAMELVDGRPITQYCAEEALSTRERLQLFLGVAEAVRYAHRNLVVHRDLKPTNILVADDGTPQLLDFGIAKLLAEETPHTRPLTQTGQLLMTPEYAAPEQVTGEAVTTATDVYQLGVLLYELLAGRRPYEFETKTPSVIEKVILQEEPPRPSTAVTRANEDGDTDRFESRHRADDALHSDLDTIVLKALRKEPERRYSSAEAMIDDVERHLEGHPIAARPATWTYQARKFVQRNRWGVGAAAGFLALLLVYAATVTVQAQRIASERDRAQAATAKAQQSAQKSQRMSQFLVSLFEEANPRRSSGKLTARDLLDDATARLDTSFSGNAVVEADLLEVIGNAYRNQGLYSKTYELHRRALALRKENEAPDDVLATAENNVGEALYYLGRYDEAQSHYRRSLSKRRRVLDSSHVDIAQSLNNLALIDIENARYKRARRRYREALSIFKNKLGEEHWRTANALNNIAQVEEQAGNPEAAERYYRRALELRRRISDAPDRDAGIVLNNLGGVLKSMKRFEEAEDAHRRALDIFRKVTAKGAPFIGHALAGLAQAKRGQKQYEEAERFFEEALTHYRKALADGHERIAKPLLAWGRMRLERGQPAKAEPLLREALHIRRAAFPEGHRKTGEARRALSAALTTLGRYEEAESTLLEGYDALRQQRGAQDSRVRAVWEQLVRLYDAWGKPARASAYRDPLDDE